MSFCRPYFSLALLAALVGACDAVPTGTSTLGGRVQFDSTFEPGRPLALLTAREHQLFDRGLVQFTRVFTPETGLGPLFNANSCAKCHDNPAIGGEGAEAAQHATAFRNGVCDELEDKGGPVIQLGATPALHDALGIYAEPIPVEATATARRTTPAIWGSGLLDAVPESEILAHADPDDRDGDGVFGHANRTDDGRVGRFGRKAQVASLRDFVAEAYEMEMGITNALFPAEQTVAGVLLPPGVDPTPDPEIADSELDATDAFVRLSAAPAPTGPMTLQVQGRGIFTRIGCASCHVPELRTGDNPVPALAHQVVPAYTDLLLHDMGPNLADICMGLATPGEFRTEPLWGLRFRFELLHDGRVKTIEQAIRLHGGEGSGARDRFAALSDTERAILLRFLGNL